MIYDKKFEKELKSISGHDLVEKLENVIFEMADFNQNGKNKGCYVILENIGRVPEADQEDLIQSMIKANPYPSRGVQTGLAGWKPTKMPSAVTIASIASVVGIEVTKVIMKVQQNEMSNDSFAKIETILVGQDKHEVAAGVAEIYAPKRLHQITKQMMDRAVELSHDGSRCEEFVSAAAYLCLKYKNVEALDLMLNSPELNHGEGLSYENYFQAAKIVGKEEWLERAIQKSLTTNLTYRLANEIYKICKNERFAEYRGPLFTAIYNGRIVPRHSCFYDASLLMVHAKMAVRFKNEVWQKIVFGAVMKQLPDGYYAHTAYKALIILAQAHESARKKLEKMPRPKRKIVLR